MLIPNAITQPDEVPLPPDLQIHFEAYLDGSLDDHEIIGRIDEHVRHHPEVAAQVRTHLALHRLSEQDWDEVRH